MTSGANSQIALVTRLIVVHAQDFFTPARYPENELGDNGLKQKGLWPRLIFSLSLSLSLSL